MAGAGYAPGEAGIGLEVGEIASGRLGHALAGGGDSSGGESLGGIPSGGAPSRAEPSCDRRMCNLRIFRYSVLRLVPSALATVLAFPRCSAGRAVTVSRSFRR